MQASRLANLWEYGSEATNMLQVFTYITFSAKQAL